MCDGKVESISWYDMRRILYGLHTDGLVDRISVYVPVWVWEQSEGMAAFGIPGSVQSLGWKERLLAGLDAGYYGIAHVSHGKSGLLGRGPDHWVMICGYRELYPPHGESGAIKQEVLVSCSSRSTPDEEWVSIRDFLRERGGFTLLLARPRVDPK